MTFLRIFGKVKTPAEARVSEDLCSKIESVSGCIGIVSRLFRVEVRLRGEEPQSVRREAFSAGSGGGRARVGQDSCP